ncbi:MAG: hypothetical protein KJ871_09335 [Alphaproteobacteria bacterium]|nr:hypothetical protein [Alphaproteobacteria bacterium]MBU2082750.1 hypothetical protein [Alphaproteobacteria bacterium]MBU2143363.1 hypothetical protein [Alphaproteobacteria bacterium]MBU2196804.1 hypothetical protein [Alphaproteobacteria bacterium]
MNAGWMNTARRADCGRRYSLRAAIVGLAVIQVISACSDERSKRSDAEASSDPAPGPVLYCDTHDCSDFPAGHISFEMNGHWVYWPSKTWLHDHGATGIVGSSAEFHSSAGFDHWGPDVPVSLPNGVVIPGASSVFIAPCCEALGQYYSIDALTETKVAQVRISNGAPASARAWPGTKTQSLDELPDAVQALSHRYFLKVEDMPHRVHRPDQGYNIRAWSKKPLVFGEKVFVHCSGYLCQAEWSGKAGGGMRVTLVNVQVFPCVNDNCRSFEAVEGRFERVERFLEGFEMMIDDMSEKPEEVER